MIDQRDLETLRLGQRRLDGLAIYRGGDEHEGKKIIASALEDWDELAAGNQDQSNHRSWQAARELLSR